MPSIARWSTHHRRIVIALWLIVLLVVSAGSRAVGSKFSNNLSLPGTDSTRAVNLLKTNFAAAAGDTDQIVFHARHGKLTDPATRAVVTRTLGRIARLPHISNAVSPYSGGFARSLSRDGTTGFATLTFDQQAGDLPQAAIARVIAAARASRSPSLQIELEGQAISRTQQPSLGPATAIGLAAAVVILLITFGSFTAMGLPILTALFGLGVGLGLVALTSHGIDTAFFVPELAAMIGLGVGVDYALLIVTRYRDAYRRNGGDVQAAVEKAMNTAGRSVLFAGITVVIALLGLFALGVGFLDGVGIAGSIAVLLMLAASNTLLPALLSLAGRRIGATRRDRRARRSGNAAADPGLALAPNGKSLGGGLTPRESLWLRWISAIQRYPWTTAIAATVLMLVLASPVLGIRLGLSDAGADPASTTTRKAYDLLGHGFGKGFNGPLQIVAQLPKPGDTRGVDQLTSALRQASDVASVGSPHLNAARTLATLPVYPTSAPQDAATTALVNHVRRSVIPPIASATKTTFYVGGWTATTVDFSHVLATKLPLFIGVVILLSTVLLLVVFRSLLIPLQAAVMNLLSIGASMGILTAIFQTGWLSSVFGTQPGPIDAFIPVLVFAIVFGLSMDYQVFLVSRIHEEWVQSNDSSKAIRVGLVSTGRVVTAAAMVMIVVFLSFVGGADRALKLFGVGLASAVFLDAIVIRMILLPAVLEILGRSTWALPGWLERRLPRFAIEAAQADDGTPPIVAHKPAVNERV